MSICIHNVVKFKIYYIITGAAASAGVSKAKTTKKAGVTRKPCRPATVNCDKDHNVTAKDDNTLEGTLKIGTCRSKLFSLKASRQTAVSSVFSSCLQKRLAALKLDSRDVVITKVSGDSQNTVLTYSCGAKKADQDKVKQALQDSCKDKDLTDTIDKEKTPDDSESSSSEEDVTPSTPSSSSHAASTPASAGKTTQKEAGSSHASAATTSAAPHATGAPAAAATTTHGQYIKR